MDAAGDEEKLIPSLQSEGLTDYETLNSRNLSAWPPGLGRNGPTEGKPGDIAGGTKPSSESPFRINPEQLIFHYAYEVQLVGNAGLGIPFGMILGSPQPTRF